MHVSSEIESLRAQLAEVSAQRNASNRKIEELTDQLLATQAHAARLVEALKAAEYGDGRFDHSGDGQCYCPECGEKKGCAHSQNCIIGKALSTPIDLDALHDAAMPQERSRNDPIQNRNGPSSFPAAQARIGRDLG